MYKSWASGFEVLNLTSWSHTLTPSQTHYEVLNKEDQEISFLKKKTQETIFRQNTSTGGGGWMGCNTMSLIIGKLLGCKVIDKWTFMHEKLHGKVVPNKTEGLYFRESNMSSEQMNPYFTSQSYGAFAVISTPTDLVAVTANSESTCIYPICRIKHLSTMIITKVVHSSYMMSCSVGQCESWAELPNPNTTSNWM